MRWSWIIRAQGLVLIGGILLLLLLFSPQVQRRPLLIIEQPLLLVESWLQGAVGVVSSWGGTIADHYFRLWRIEEDNSRLREELGRARGDLTLAQEQLAESARRDALQTIGQKFSGGMIARVIGRDPTNWYQSVLIDRGQRDGLRPDMGVAVADGVVGSILKVMNASAVVLLISDRNSVIPGLVQRSRDQGLIEGDNRGALRMKYLSNLADVQIGDLVVSSGLTPSFPKGLRIGTVTERQPGTVSQQAMLSPAADLSKLEEVYVLPLMKPEAS